MAFGNRSGQRFTSAFTVSNAALSVAGAIPGATFQAQRSGVLHFGVLLANPVVADPTTSLSLSQSAGSSAFTAGQTVYVAQTQNNANGSTTVGQSLASTAITAAGNLIATTVTVQPGASSVGIYVGTTNTPLLLGTISSTGTITYSGGATSGLAVTVSGSTLTITIGAAATTSGSAEPTSNTTASPQVLNQTWQQGQGSTAIGAVNSGSAIPLAQWYTFDEPMVAGSQITLSLSGPAKISLSATFEEG